MPTASVTPKSLDDSATAGAAAPGQEMMKEQIPDVKVAGIQMGDSCAKLACGACFWNPFTWAGVIQKVDVNEHMVVLYNGKYFGTRMEPGLYCSNPCGRQLRSVSTKYTTLQLRDVKVLDQKGSPVVISAVVTFCFTSARKACIDVENPDEYLRFQARATMKEVVAAYPYSSDDGHSLQSSAKDIGEEAIRILQQKVNITGAKIQAFEFVDMSYAPEVAQVMLVRQQAEALVDARRIVVSAAVDMTAQAVKELETKGVQTSAEGKERIASNMLSVICSHSSVTPTLNVASS